MVDTVIQINITGKLSYSDEITIGQATQIIAFLNADESGRGLREVNRDGGIRTRELQTRQVENPREAIETSGAQTNPEKIVTLGAYVLQDGGDTFKAEDVKSQFRRARETVPGNFARDLGVAISAGWISEHHDTPGEYYLTSKVDGIFDGGFAFPKGSGNANRQRGGKKGVSKTKTGNPDTLAEIDEFDSTMDGYPPYSKLRNEKDRLLWVATYMRDKHARKSLSNKEIAWISDHIGVGIPSDNVAGAFNSAKTRGYAVRSTLDKSIRVTDEGVQHLVSLPSEHDT